MIYRVFWQREALEDLRTLPPKTATSIVKKVETYLAQQPKALGAPLLGQFAGLWHYRFGDYRILYEIAEDIVCIYAVRVGHRKDIYE